MSIPCILAEQLSTSSSGGAGLLLKKLEITKYPTKTEYLSGDAFDPSGIELTASYGIEDSTSIIATAVIPINSVLISPSTLTDGNNYVTFSYTERGITVTTKLAVSVSPALQDLEISSMPDKTTYEWGDSFSTAGLEVKAVYTDGSKVVISNYSTSLANGSTLNGSMQIGTNEVTISYSEDGKSAQISFDITIEKKKLAAPSQSGSLTYNGNTQSPVLSNYNSSLMSITGSSQVNAGSYTAVVSLRDTDHYQWTDGTTASKDVPWSIGKAAGSLSINKTSISLSDTTTQTVTITKTGDGVISYSPSSVSGLTLSLSGNILSITGNGNTNISSQTIIISVAEGTNWTKPSDVTFTVSASYFIWADNDTTVGDAEWWAKLKAKLPTMTAEERAACVGKKKKVTLSTSVGGWNSGAEVSMICIGYDVDADNSLTFQTEGVSPNVNTYMDDSNNGYIYYSISKANTISDTFAKNCNASASILTVTKLYSGQGSNSDLGEDSTYYPANMTVTVKGFTLSAIEAGNGYESVSKEEGTQGRPVKSYQYFTSNSRREKYISNGDGSLTSGGGIYWLRSRWRASWDSVMSVGYRTWYPTVDHFGMIYRSSYRADHVHTAPAFVIG